MEKKKIEGYRRERGKNVKRRVWEMLKARTINHDIKRKQNKIVILMQKQKMITRLILILRKNKNVKRNGEVLQGRMRFSTISKFFDKWRKRLWRNSRIKQARNYYNEKRRKKCLLAIEQRLKKSKEKSGKLKEMEEKRRKVAKRISMQIWKQSVKEKKERGKFIMEIRAIFMKRKLKRAIRG